MLDLSMGEIGVIAGHRVGRPRPRQTPSGSKNCGSLMGKAQRFVSQVKNDIDKEVELSELKKIQEDAKKMASDLQSSLKNTTDSIEKQVSDVRDSVTSAGQEVKSTMDNASKELKDQWMESTAPKAELSMENIVDGTAKTETASASTGLGKDAAWENLDKSVDTSMHGKSFRLGCFRHQADSASGTERSGSYSRILQFRTSAGQYADDRSQRSHACRFNT